MQVFKFLRKIKSFIKQGKHELYQYNSNKYGTVHVIFLGLGKHKKKIKQIKHDTFEFDFLWIPDAISCIEDQKNYIFNGYSSFPTAVIYGITKEEIIEIRPIHATTELFPNNSVVGFEICFLNEKIIILKHSEERNILKKSFTCKLMYFKNSMLQEITNIEEQN